MRDLYSLKLSEILPSSISSSPNVQAAASAIDSEIQLASQDIREALIISRIEELPEAVLDLLAWQWHVDFYEPEHMSMAAKRRLVKTSIPVHRKKGTKWAVTETLRAIGIEAEISEWYEYGGAPYTFKVRGKLLNPLSPWETWGPDTNALAVRAVMETKSARSGLDGLILEIIFDFGDIIFSLPEHLYKRREYRQGRAVWSLMPSFDYLDADALPLDWRPWKGYIRQLREAKTAGRLTGVSHLDRFLHLDRVDADFWPLDIALPYYETDNPPIIVPVLLRNTRSAQVAIRGPTSAKISRYRRTLDLAATLLIRQGGFRQLRTGSAKPRAAPGHLDKYLRFDQMYADFIPLDTVIPRAEDEDPSELTHFLYRASREINGAMPVTSGGSVPAQRRIFYSSPGLRLGAAFETQKRTGKAAPAGKATHTDDFLTLDSTPADFMPLDSAFPNREGIFVWR